MNFYQRLADLGPWMIAFPVLGWALALVIHRRRIGRFLTSIEVEHADWAGARIKHPTFRLKEGGRWAVWPVWDHEKYKILRFEKRRLGWRTPRAAATFEQFSEYRRASGDERPFPTSALADEARPRRPELDDQPSALYESLFDQQYKELTREYQDERRGFWTRRIPLLIGGAFLAGLVVALALLPFRSQDGGPFWLLLAIAGLPFLGIFVFWTGGVPRRPSRADAALVVLLQVEQEKERRSGGT
jgi:hypothetical protein